MRPRKANRPEPGILASPGPARHASQLIGHRAAITALAVAPDGRQGLSADESGLAILWDLQSGFELHTFSSSASIHATAFSCDGVKFALAGVGASANESIVMVHDSERGGTLGTLELHDVVHSLAFFPDGGRLLLGCTSELRLWDIAEPTCLGQIPLCEAEQIRAVAVSRDGGLALAGCYRGQGVRLLSLKKSAELYCLLGHGDGGLFRPGAVMSVAFSPDGLRAISGGWDEKVRVWNLQTGKECGCFSGHRGWFGRRGVLGVAWLADGERAVSASEDGRVRLWDVKSAKEQSCWQHKGGVCCFAATADGHWALTGGRNGTVRVWELGA